MSLYGSIFRVMTFGESHGAAVGCVVDGVPPGLEFSTEDVQKLLNRRRPGQSSLTTKRNEGDVVEILSGTENGITLGSPVAMIVRNQDMRKFDYENTLNVPRPGHADYTYQMKFGIRSSSGGGRSSARETVGRVCASSIAMKFLACKCGIQISSFVDSVMEIGIPQNVKELLISTPLSMHEIDQKSTLLRTADCLIDSSGSKYSLVTGESISMTFEDPTPLESIVTRCPHPPTAAKIVARISELRDKKDSCGGTVYGVISGLPVGLGEPVFDKFHAEIAKAVMSIPAVKGFEIGSGFEGSRTMTGSGHNDRFISRSEFGSNHAGGVLGGVTTGQIVYFRVALKPVSSIGIAQETCDFEGNPTTLCLEGRHDPCVVPRAPQVIDSMVAITVMDFVLRNNVYKCS